MACPYCTKLYFILTVFVAPQCGGTLFFFAVGTKSMKILVNVSAKQNYQISKKRRKAIFEMKPMDDKNV